MTRYSKFALDEDTRNFMGETEDKMVLARQHGSNDEIDKRLTALTGISSRSHPGVRLVFVLFTVIQSVLILIYILFVFV